MRSPLSHALLLLIPVASSAHAQDSVSKKTLALQQAQIQQILTNMTRLDARVRKLENTTSWVEPHGFVVYNSVGKEGGETHAFWNILYKDRLSPKGSCGTALESNCYIPGHYLMGAGIYTDVIEDVTGKAVVAMVASATGIDTESMRMKDPQFLSGNGAIYGSQFAAAWSSPDVDKDDYAPSNCATMYGNVTQHYSGCWNYNLGGDANEPVADNGWGPHLNSSFLPLLGLSPGSDTSSYVRVKRITRFWKPK